METLARRTQRAVEGLLENETLTADLADAPAQVLLNWGIECTTWLVQTTAHLADDEAADEAIYPQRKALRRLIRQINRWVSKLPELDDATNTKNFEKCLAYAQTIYGEALNPPQAFERRMFLRWSLKEDAVHIIMSLHKLLTPASVDS